MRCAAYQMALPLLGSEWFETRAAHHICAAACVQPRCLSRPCSSSARMHVVVFSIIPPFVRKCSRNFSFTVVCIFIPIFLQLASNASPTKITSRGFVFSNVDFIVELRHAHTCFQVHTQRRAFCQLLPVCHWRCTRQLSAPARPQRRILL